MKLVKRKVTQVQMPYTPEQVYLMATYKRKDRKNFQTVDTGVEMDPYNPPPIPRGQMVLQLIEKTPPKRFCFVMHYELFDNFWDLTIEPAQGGSLVTLEETYKFHKGNIGPFMITSALTHLGAEHREYFKKLRMELKYLDEAQAAQKENK